MSHLVTVYDDKGEPFEVGHEVAANLVLNKGWSRTAPAPAPEPAAAPAEATDDLPVTDYRDFRLRAQRGE